MSNTRSSNSANANVPFYYNLSQSLLHHYISISSNAQTMKNLIDKASEMKTFMNKDENHIFAQHLSFESKIKGFIFSDKDLPTLICRKNFFGQYKQFSSLFVSHIKTSLFHPETDWKSVMDQFSTYEPPVIKKAMYALEIETLYDYVVHRVKAFKAYFIGHCNKIGRPADSQAFIAKIAKTWEQNYIITRAIDIDNSADLDPENFQPLDEISSMFGDKAKSQTSNTGAKSAMQVKLEQVSPAKSSIVSVAKKQVIVSLDEQIKEEEVKENKIVSKLEASNFSLLSMLDKFKTNPNLVLSKVPASRAILYGSLHDYFSPAVTLQMAHIFYAAKQLGQPTFSNLGSSLFTCKTRMDELIKTRDMQESLVQNKEIISYLLYVYSSTSHNVVPFPAQILMGPFVSACNGFNKSMSTTCGYSESNILLDTFVVDLMHQIDSDDVRYNCLFSVEPLKLSVGKVGDPQFIIGSRMGDKNSLKTQYSVLVREPFHTSMYDLLVRVKNHDSLAAKITAANMKPPMMMLQSTYETLKGLPQFKRFFEVLPTNFIKYYSARDYGKAIDKESLNKEFLKEQRIKDMDNAATVDFVLKYLKDNKAIFRPKSTDPLLTQFLNLEEPDMKQKRAILKALKQILLVSDDQKSYKFITVESVSKFDQLLSPFNKNDTQQCIKDHLRYQGFNQLFSAYIYTGKQLYPFRLRARKDYNKSWTPYISNSKYKEAAEGYFKGDCVLARQTFFQMVLKHAFVLTNQNNNLLVHESADIPLKDAIPFVAPLLLAGPTQTVDCSLQLDFQSFSPEKVADAISNIVIYSVKKDEEEGDTQERLANKVNTLFKNNPYLDKHKPVFSEDTGCFYELLGGHCTKSAASLIYGVTQWNSMFRLVPSLIERIEWFGQYVAFYATMELKNNAKISQAEQLKWYEENSGYQSLEQRIEAIKEEYGDYLTDAMIRPDIEHHSFVTIPDAKMLGKRTFEITYTDFSHDDQLDFETSFQIDEDRGTEENEAFKDFYRAKVVRQKKGAKVVDADGTQSEAVDEGDLNMMDSENEQ